ncbi:MAG TPA: hypothetical protein VNR87_14575 [Flavisolibacter sp.]|nr:hypothetical protein [Flavisolibacter sp.]
MENLIFLLATSFALRLSSSKKFKNFFIGDTGCSALLLSSSDVQRTKTVSGDHLYFSEFNESKVGYGLICIHLKQECDLNEASEMLHSYMEKLRGPFYVLHNTGIQKDVDWNTDCSKTLVDYWQDADKQDWKVKGYTDGRFMAVLYVKNISQVEVRKQDLFLDSFHFGPAA